MTPRRRRSRRGVLVRTIIPASAGVVQEAGVPLRPSISTRQRRQEPKASTLSVAQSFGMGLSIRAAAAMTEVPGGTLTLRPSMVSVTVASPVRIGVPVSSSCNSDMADLRFRRDARWRLGEILAEMIKRAKDGHRGKPAESAERAVGHHLAKIAQKLDVLFAVPASDDLVDGLHAPRRTDPAGRAFAAAFLGAELHGKARLSGHVDAVVEDDDAAMAQHPAASRHRLIVERRIDERFRKISAERAADLNRADRPTRPRAAPKVFDEFAQSSAEREFDEAAVADVSCELERLRAQRSAHAVGGVGLRAMLENPRRGRKAQHIVDDCRLAEEARNRGQRRLHADLPALPLQALQERRLFAADICAGPESRLEVERVPRAKHTWSKQASGPRALDRSLKGRESMRIFGADIDIALGRADREPRDRHALDKQERIAFHEHAVSKRAAVALVGVADDILLIGLDSRGRAPFDAGRKPGAATSAPARGQNRLDCRLRAQSQRALQTPKSAMAAIIVERQRVGQSAAGEYEALLFRKIGNVVDLAQRFGMSPAIQEVRLEQLSGLTRSNRPVADAAGVSLDFDKRFEPEEASRSGADKLDVEAAAARLIANPVRDEVRANGERGRIRGNENADGHWVLPCAAATIASIRSRSRRPTGAPSSEAAGERAQLPRQ